MFFHLNTSPCDGWHGMTPEMQRIAKAAQWAERQPRPWNLDFILALAYRYNLPEGKAQTAVMIAAKQRAAKEKANA